MVLSTGLVGALLVSWQAGFANHGTAAGKSYLTLEAPFTQELIGTDGHFFGGIAFASDGDVFVDDCSFSGSHLHRFDMQGAAAVVNGTQLHPSTIVNSNAGCGLTNHTDGFIYSNTSLGATQINASTGAYTGRAIGPAGNALGITTDPQTGDIVYLHNNCRSSGFCDVVTVNTVTGVSSTFAHITSVSFADGIYFNPDGSQLFLAKRSPGTGVTIVDRTAPGARTGVFNRTIPTAEPDGIAFHATGGFVVIMSVNGAMYKIVPGPDTVTTFASGGGRHDLSQVGPVDGCLYTTQDNFTRYDNGATSSLSSVVRICSGFVAPARRDERPPLCSLTPRSGPPPFKDGMAIDNRPSEDVDNSGTLDPGEDTNGNGKIDVDTGIFSVELLPGAVNTDLSVVPFAPAQPIVDFSVHASNSLLPAVALVQARDGENNACTAQVALGQYNPFGSVVRGSSRTRGASMPRPSPNIEGFRCVETMDPSNPNYMMLPFIPFTSDPMNFDVILSQGDGEKIICCQYRDNTGVISPSLCSTLILESGPGARSAEYWEHQCSSQSFRQFPREEVNAMFNGISAISSAVTECVPTGCSVLQTGGRDLEGDLRPERVEYLALQLNIASGKIRLADPISLPGLTTAATVADAIAEIEAILCDPLQTLAMLQHAGAIAAAINGPEDMDVAGPTSVVSGQRGATKSIPVGVINMSGGPRDYQVSVSGGWPMTLSEQQVMGLGSGAVRSLTLFVQIPASAAPGDSIEVTLQAADVTGGVQTIQREVKFTVSASAPDAPQNYRVYITQPE